MNAQEFYLKVVEMRIAQKTYFRTRTQQDLRLARKLEGDIDREIDRVRGILYEREKAAREDCEMT